MEKIYFKYTQRNECILNFYSDLQKAGRWENEGFFLREPDSRIPCKYVGFCDISRNFMHPSHVFLPIVRDEAGREYLVQVAPGEIPVEINHVPIYTVQNWTNNIPRGIWGSFNPYTMKWEFWDGSSKFPKIKIKEHGEHNGAHLRDNREYTNTLKNQGVLYPISVYRNNKTEFNLHPKFRSGKYAHPTKGGVYFSSTTESCEDVSSSCAQSKSDWDWNNENEKILLKTVEEYNIFSNHSYGNNFREGWIVKKEDREILSIHFTGSGIGWGKIEEDELLFIPEHLCFPGCSVYDKVCQSEDWNIVEDQNLLKTLFE